MAKKLGDILEAYYPFIVGAYAFFTIVLLVFTAMISGDLPTDESRYSLWVGLVGPFFGIHDLGNMIVISHAPNLIKNTHICIMVFLGIRGIIGLVGLISTIIFLCTEAEKIQEIYEEINGAILVFICIIECFIIAGSIMTALVLTDQHINRMQREMDIHIVNSGSLAVSITFSVFGGFSGIYTHIAWERLRPHMNEYDGELFHTGFYIGTFFLYTWCIVWIIAVVCLIVSAREQIRQLRNKTWRKVSEALFGPLVSTYLILTGAYFIFYLMSHGQLDTDAKIWLGSGIISPACLGFHDIGNLIGLGMNSDVSRDVFIPMMIVTGMRVIIGIPLIICLAICCFYNYGDRDVGEMVIKYNIFTIIWFVVVFMITSVVTGNAIKDLEDKLDVDVVDSAGVGCTIFFGSVLYPLQIYTIIAFKRIYPYIEQYEDLGSEFPVSGFWFGSVWLGIGIVVTVVLCAFGIEWVYDRIPETIPTVPVESRSRKREDDPEVYSSVSHCSYSFTDDEFTDDELDVSTVTIQ